MIFHSCVSLPEGKSLFCKPKSHISSPRNSTSLDVSRHNPPWTLRPKQLRSSSTCHEQIARLLWDSQFWPCWWGIIYVYIYKYGICMYGWMHVGIYTWVGIVSLWDVLWCFLCMFTVILVIWLSRVHDIYDSYPKGQETSPMGKVGGMGWGAGGLIPFLSLSCFERSLL